MPRAADVVYDDLRQRILSGTLAPGERLREETVADSLGVSRTPVREALRRLDSEGFVKFEPHRGAHVTTWSGDELEEIFALRALLEGHSAALAAARVTDEQCSELRTLAERMATLASNRRLDHARIATLNGEFHQRVQQVASSARLAGMLGMLVQLPLVHQTFARYSREGLERSARHHLELVAALEARDPEWAESVMRAHVRAALATLRHASTSS